MSSQRIGRLGLIVSAALLGVAMGVGPAAAANPNWDIVITPRPAAVGAGKDAGFDVSVINNGPSNINALRVIVTPTDTPSAMWTYLSPLTYTLGGPAVCGTTTPLTCELGTLVGGASVSFTVAYLVPATLGGNFDLNVAIRAGTGDPDGKNNSRGDKYEETNFAQIRGGDFDAGFSVGADVYQTNPTLGTKNIQATTLERAPQLVPVTIEDGIATLAACDNVADSPDCTGLFGEWSRLNVNNGNGGVDFGQPFKVTLMVRGGPGGGSAGDIAIIHVLDNGTIQLVDQTCTFAGTDPVPTNVECLVATKVGNNWKLEVWLLKNGFVRGGI